MTREEAIQYIDGLRCEEDFPYTDTIADFIKERNEAIDMAIESLSAEAEQGVGRYENAMQKLRDMPRYLNGVKKKQITEISVNYTTKKPNDVVEQKNDVVAEPTDLISRADALEELGEYFDHLKRIDKRGIKRIEPISLDCKGIINKLPSADRPSGEWISNNDGSWNCSECGLRVFIYAKGNYCPNCGADMRGEPHDD